MKFQILALVALFLGIHAQDFDGSYEAEDDNVRKAKNKCFLDYEVCVNATNTMKDKWKCHEALEICEEKAELEKIEITTTDAPPPPPKKEEVDHHRHHGHHGHHHRHHHKKHHMCQKHFCKCFKALVGCIRKQHNKTMEPEAPEMIRYEDSEKFNSGPKEEDISMPQMASFFLGAANNGSKGNGTKVCFKTFKACLMKRPQPKGGKGFSVEFHEENEEYPEMEESDGEKGIYSYGGMGPRPNRPTMYGSNWKDFGKKKGKKFASKFVGRKHGFMRGAWNKMRSFGRKIAAKVKMAFGSRFESRHHGQHHRHHGHNHRHHGHPKPFRRCVFFVKMCKWRAGGSKKKMRECAKRFARCVLGICKRIGQ